MSLDENGSGTAPSTGGGSGAAGGTPDIELTFADVEKIGQDTAALADKAAAASSSLADARGHAAAFGSYPPAQALQSHHQAVVGVFEETLAAIRTDLDNFGAAIVQASHAHEQNDDDTYATLVSLNSTLNGNPVWDRYVDARNQQGHQLEDVELEHPEQLPDDVKNVLDEAEGGEPTDNPQASSDESAPGFVDSDTTP
jgi:hypothetical protein